MCSCASEIERSTMLHNVVANLYNVLAFHVRSLLLHASSSLKPTAEGSWSPSTYSSTPSCGFSCSRRRGGRHTTDRRTVHPSVCAHRKLSSQSSHVLQCVLRALRRRCARHSRDLFENVGARVAVFWLLSVGRVPCLFRQSHARLFLKENILKIAAIICFSLTGEAVHNSQPRRFSERFPRKHSQRLRNDLTMGWSTHHEIAICAPSSMLRQLAINFRFCAVWVLQENICLEATVSCSLSRHTSRIQLHRPTLAFVFRKSFFAAATHEATAIQQYLCEIGPPGPSAPSSFRKCSLMIFRFFHGEVLV